MSAPDFDGTRIDVTASKPGRWVGVVVDRPMVLSSGDRPAEHLPLAVVLSI